MIAVLPLIPCAGDGAPGEVRCRLEGQPGLTDAELRDALVIAIDRRRPEVQRHWALLLEDSGQTHERALLRRPERVDRLFGKALDVWRRYLIDDAVESRWQPSDRLTALYVAAGQQWAARSTTPIDATRLAATPRMLTAMLRVADHEPGIARRRLDGLAHELAAARTWGYTTHWQQEATKWRLGVTQQQVERAVVAAAERRSLALELHDTLAQCLAAVALSVERCQHLLPATGAEACRDELELLERNASDALESTRAMITALHAGSSGALPDSVQDLLTSVERAADTGIVHVVELTGPLPALEPDIERTLVRVLQEALANARRHALPTTIRVSVCRDGDDLVLTVADDGGGFDVDRVVRRAAFGRHFGLLGMRERIAAVGGELCLVSERGVGTRVEVRFPLAWPGR